MSKYKQPKHRNHLGKGTTAAYDDDGQVLIRFNRASRRLQRNLEHTLKRHLTPSNDPDNLSENFSSSSTSDDEAKPSESPLTGLNVVIQIVGSRGDVQPFIAFGKVLKSKYGHRIRVATHPTFKEFVEENGLEFFSIGGDPAELMSFMVKNPGLMPDLETLKHGDIGKRRKDQYEMLKGCWRSCLETGNGMSGPVAAGGPNTRMFINSDPKQKPFLADAIIANPPSFAHVHIAERLCIPVHLMFTMPWSPTHAFPHPLANVNTSSQDPSTTNLISYTLVSMLTWQGLGDLINRFREKYLSLDPLDMGTAPSVESRLRVPYTYAFSPSMIPKPKDWASHIRVSGFFFLDQASDYTPDEKLQAFLDAGEPPVYIGFGSIVVDDPNELTKVVFEAIKKSGVRAIVSKGWGGFGGDELDVPDNVFMLGNVPFDWLFKHVKAVCHHGGAGTTATGVSCGKPTIVVPFFGDQPFWGAMIHRSGAGPEPIPHKELNADRLADAIKFCLKEDVQQKARELGESIRNERGCDNAAEHFQSTLSKYPLRCSVLPNRTATWRDKRTGLPLSSLASTVLMYGGWVHNNDLTLYKPMAWRTTEGNWGPWWNFSSALWSNFERMVSGLADVPIGTFRALKHMGTRLEAPDEKSATIDEQASQTEDKTEAQHKRPNRMPVPNRNPESYRKEHHHGDKMPEDAPNLHSEPGPLLANAIFGSGVGPLKSVGALLRLPGMLFMGLARGFHALPPQYHDGTSWTRDLPDPTGIVSGIRLAVEIFALDLGDGLVGILTLPVRDARAGGEQSAARGVAGFGKGLAKGLAGAVVKPLAGSFALPGYALYGMHAQILRYMGREVDYYRYVIRRIQGHKAWEGSTAEERALVVKAWKEKLDEQKSKGCLW